MSKIILSPLSSRLSLTPRHKLVAASQLSQFRGSLLSRSSRASPSWAPSTNTNRINTWSICSNCRLDSRTFSTSLARRAESRDRETVQTKDAPEGPQDKNLPPPSLPKTTLQSLKSKLNLPITPSHRHENIYTIPNILTFSRLLATPLIGYLIIHDQHLYAFGLFVYAGISDLLDGWIARKWHLQTVVGSVVDPMADKALMTTLVSCLAVNGSLPLPLAVVILGRDVSLAIAAIYYRYASLPKPKTFKRYWDFSLPSAEVHPTTISKLNTFLQLVLIGTTLCINLLHDPSAIASSAGTYLQSIQQSLGGEEGVRTMVRAMQVVVASTTIWSGLSYAWLKSAVKILGEDEVLKKKQGFRGRMIVGGCFGSVVLFAAGLAWRDFLQSEEDAMDESHD